ncbi:hypothetical protein BH09BAC5_BH09BAC5_01080 [soil metagenome]
MKIFITTYLIVFISAISYAQSCADTANIYSFSYNGHSYEVVKEVKNWTNASACAVTRGGHLVEINSAGEDSAVYNAITVGAGITNTYASVPDGGNIAYVWMGGTDRQTEGTWLWDGNYDNSGINFWTGQGTAGAGGGLAIAGNYNHWGGTSQGTAEEPDDYIGIQDCGAIGLNTWPHGIASEWNDISGLNNLYFVIEYDSLLGIDEQESKFQSRIYPNPSYDIVNISNENKMNRISEMKVLDQMGNLIFCNSTINSDKVTLDVTRFSNGIYFVLLTYENGKSEYRKISVIR